MTKWDDRFIRIAEEVRSWSKDPGTKVGCVLVRDKRILATGYNGFPANLSDSLHLYNRREYKLAITVHAECNALFNAAKNGVDVSGCTAYVTFHPCSQCAAALIQSGVKLVICPDPSLGPPRWREAFKVGGDILVEAGLTILYYSEAEADAFKKV